jgi:hypothetical protein
MCPDTFLTDHGTLKAVFLCHANEFNPDSVGNYVRLSWVRSVFSKEFKGHLEGKFVCVQDFMENHNFFKHLDFKFQEDPDYWTAMTTNILRTDTDFFPEKTLETGSDGKQESSSRKLLRTCREKLAEIGNAYAEEIETKDDLVYLGFNIENIMEDFDGISQQLDQKEYVMKMNQLQFYLTVFAQKMLIYKLDEAHKKVKNLVDLIIKQLPSSESGLSLDITGKRIAKDSLSLKTWCENHGTNEQEHLLKELREKGIKHPFMNSEYLWSYEMLNHRLFSNNNFFIYKGWEEELKTKLTKSQYRENVNKQVMTNFVVSPRVLTPNTKGSMMKHSQTVSMHWDQLVYKVVPEKQEQALKYDEIIYGEEPHELTKTDQYKLSLCNMLWDLRMSSDPGKNLTDLFACNFWEKLITQEQGSKPEIRLSFDAGVYNESWLDSTGYESLYSLKFEKFREMRREILKFRELVHDVIPDYYSRVNDFSEKQELFRFSDYAKRRYAELLKKYEKEFVRKDSLFGSSNFLDYERDMVTDVEKEYSLKSTQVATEERILQTEEELRVFSQNNLVQMMLLSRKKAGKEMSGPMADLCESFEQNVEKNLFHLTNGFLNQVLDWTLGDIFSEKDFQELAHIFPHCQLERFPEFSVSDFLMVLNLGVSATYIDLHQKITCARNLQIQTPSINPDSLLESELPTFNNVGKFLSVFTENYTSLLAAGLDMQEEKDMHSLYMFRKEKERNVPWTQADAESFKDYVHNLPLIQQPLESVRKWISRREQESLLRNSRNQSANPTLTVSDNKIAYFLRHRTKKNLNDLALSLFEKSYENISTLDLTKLCEHLIERMYLLKKNPPLNFFELAHFILNHPQLHMVDRVNFLESADVFEIDFNEFHLDQILAEFPVIHDDTSDITAKDNKMEISDVVNLANCLNVPHRDLY